MTTDRSTLTHASEPGTRRRGRPASVAGATVWLVASALLALTGSLVAAQPASAAPPKPRYSTDFVLVSSQDGQVQRYQCRFELTDQLRWTSEYDMRIRSRVGCKGIRLSGGMIHSYFHKTDTTEKHMYESGNDREYSEGGYSWVMDTAPMRVRTCRYDDYYGFWADATVADVKFVNPANGDTGYLTYNPHLASNQVFAVGAAFRRCTRLG